ncbi:T9SS type A sorting domain-containing protein [Flavobacterium silvaticum]|uniref:T9SS type A sorting domain-containing protein n=1 Tax=Flavobacterium silvaticum TaxID=1852020 RepID=A0A972FKW6_9FLAO|nr:T9SS type A sorting domain-containing protein [Flavobacterium silvaticum]NMH27841.1 T9SS type A sorting domain-containing protein [Flavobacterium silvaticum]
MKKMLLLACMGIAHFVNGQITGPSSLYGGTDWDYSRGIAPAPGGGFVSVGETFSNNGDIPANLGAFDGWAFRTDASGTLSWSFNFGGTDYDYLQKVQPTPDGAFIAAGYSWSNDGDCVGNHGNQDAWVMKFSATGDVIWSKLFGGFASDFAYDIITTSDGGYAFCGETWSQSGDVVGNPDNGAAQIWIVKLDADGNITWSMTYGGSDGDYGYRLNQTPDNGFICIGETSSNNVQVSNNHGNEDIWVVKTSSGGTLEWAKTYGGSGSDQGRDIQPTADGGYILVAAANSNNPEGDITGSHGFFDAWVAKLTSTGDIEWSRMYGGSGEDEGMEIYPTQNGYIVMGHTRSFDGDFGGITGDVDTFLMKIEADGDIVWADTFGTSADDRCYNLFKQGNQYTMAGYSSSLEGSLGTPHGGRDAWLMQVTDNDPLAVFSTEAQLIKAYPNPVRHTLSFSGEQALESVAIYNAIGILVKSKDFDTLGRSIDVSDLQTGTYLATVKTKDATKTFTIIKK